MAWIKIDKYLQGRTGSNKAILNTNTGMLIEREPNTEYYLITINNNKFGINEEDKRKICKIKI